MCGDQFQTTNHTEKCTLDLTEKDEKGVKFTRTCQLIWGVSMVNQISHFLSNLNGRCGLNENSLQLINAETLDIDELWK